MTRPGVIRADTIDLQDQSSPSAQDHSRKPQPAGNGSPASSHQASELRHVEEERHSEEENLARAWNHASGLSEEPPSDDERDFTDDLHADINHPSSQLKESVSSNIRNGEDNDMTDGESGDDMDDDAMDKMSSSPSISDGGLFSYWKRRPKRHSPRPYTPTPSHHNRRNPPDSEESTDGSSPFVNAPAHLPLSPFQTHTTNTSHTSRFQSSSKSRPNTLSEFEDLSSSSPFTFPPAHFPLHCPREVQSEVHHHFVGFDAPPGSTGHFDEEDHPEESALLDDSFASERCDTVGPLLSETPTIIISRPLPEKPVPKLPLYEQPQLVKSLSDLALQCELLQADDPQLVRSPSDIALDSELLPMDDPELVPSSPHSSLRRNLLLLIDNPDLVRSPSDIALEGQLLPVEDPKLVRSPSDMAIDCELLPVHDPLIRSDSDKELDQHLLPDADPQLEDEEAWETESESPSTDSFESADFHNNFDEPKALLFPQDARFVDSGWGGECLRETEDIDFEFVYALHTFVATVEGQANAQKGDTMVLLDDSNSYWWLVRVVKDSTIGYLPAEHIETPTERLARLNKHRNVDLSQTMLGDTTEKTKNPLKKAIRRRNAKQVTFSAPTYVEPSDYEFSSDEEMDEDSNLNGDAPVEDPNVDKGEQRDQDEIISVVPLSVKQAEKDGSLEKKEPAEIGEEGRRNGGEDGRLSDEIFDQQFKGSGKSRNGTVRNTDSFFRDESIETRKITLTPNILRDDSSGSSTTRSLDKERVSLDLLQPDSKEKVKEDKKKKDKKPGMLSGLFKRKDKKKGSDSDPSLTLLTKVSGDSARGSPSMSLEDSPIERQTQLNNDGPQRAGSRNKLHKNARVGSPVSPSNETMSPSGLQLNTLADLATRKQASPESVTTAESSDSFPRSVSPDKTGGKPSLRVQPPDHHPGSQILADISNKLRSPTKDVAMKREKVKRAKQREALDVDSSPEEEKPPDPFADSFAVDLSKQQPENSAGSTNSSAERLSESPVHITNDDAAPDSEPPALVGDSSSTSSADELASLRSSPSPPMSSSTVTALNSDPSRVRSAPVSAPTTFNGPDSPVPTTAPLVLSRLQRSPTSLPPPPPTRSPPPQPISSPKSSLPPISGITETEPQHIARKDSTSTTASALSPHMSTRWSDANLRAYLDDASDIRDLLLVVHDTSGVVPVGREHPLMANLFVEERGKVAEMNLALDGLLSGWLARRKMTSGVSVNGDAGETRKLKSVSGGKI